ncbi:hypothetical protein BURK2_04189 [Burkholderiales bacterium]|nr:hypothetical protein BURK2_04189 [Burkholderiales bacterium]
MAGPDGSQSPIESTPRPVLVRPNEKPKTILPSPPVFLDRLPHQRHRLGTPAPGEIVAAHDAPIDSTAQAVLQPNLGLPKTRLGVFPEPRPRSNQAAAPWKPCGALRRCPTGGSRHARAWRVGAHCGFLRVRRGAPPEDVICGVSAARLSGRGRCPAAAAIENWVCHRKHERRRLGETPLPPLRTKGFRVEYFQPSERSPSPLSRQLPDQGFDAPLSQRREALRPRATRRA